MYSHPQLDLVYLMSGCTCAFRGQTFKTLLTSTTRYRKQTKVITHHVGAHNHAKMYDHSSRWCSLSCENVQTTRYVHLTGRMQNQFTQSFFYNFTQVIIYKKDTKDMVQYVHLTISKNKSKLKFTQCHVFIIVHASYLPITVFLLVQLCSSVSL